MECCGIGGVRVPLVFDMVELSKRVKAPRSCNGGCWRETRPGASFNVRPVFPPGLRNHFRKASRVLAPLSTYIIAEQTQASVAQILMATRETSEFGDCCTIDGWKEWPTRVWNLASKKVPSVPKSLADFALFASDFPLLAPLVNSISSCTPSNTRTPVNECHLLVSCPSMRA